MHLVCYVGSYTEGGGEGITCWDRDPETGHLRRRGVAAELANPSFLARHPSGRWLYAVSELAEGAVHAFEVEPSGKLRALGGVPTRGAEPCHLTVDPSGRYVLVANYQSGSVAVVPVRADGGLGEATDLVQHVGSGPHVERQAGPHAHMVAFDPDGRLFVTDLGTDEIHMYDLDLATGRLRAAGKPVATAAGAGPRHLVFHPDGLVHVVCELDSTVTTFERGSGLQAVRRVATTAAPPGGDNFPSGIGLSADARFLYVANRGTDCITTFALEGGWPRPIADVPCGGNWPRHFDVVDDFLYVANQHSGRVTLLRADRKTGIPEAARHEVETPSPAHLVWM